MELARIAARQGRLSSFLRKEFGLSSGLMNRLKWQQAILVNGVPQHTNYPVQPGDRVTVVLDEPTPDYPAEDGELTVLYEDDHFLAVDKPAGMLIHPSRCQNSGTLANRVIAYYRRTGQKCAFHPITRLDRDTFGVVLLAKNAHIHAAMNQHPFQKTYHAIVYGAPEEARGVIDAPIARKPLPSLLREVRQDGKPSLTEYKLLARLGEQSLLSLTPITGRTHQLRVHCAYRGFPILGDPQYGSEASKSFSAAFGLESQLLCAQSLVFSHPVTQKTVEIHSKLDVDFLR